MEGDEDDIFAADPFIDILSFDTESRKRDREFIHSKYTFDGIGEDDHSETEVQIFIKDPSLELWKHKTLYTLRTKPPIEETEKRFWAPWKSEHLNGKVALIVRDREWKAGVAKYRLKQVGEDVDGWRRYRVDNGKSAIGATDADKISVRLKGKKMTLQQAIDKLSSEGDKK